MTILLHLTFGSHPQKIRISNYKLASSNRIFWFYWNDIIVIQNYSIQWRFSASISVLFYKSLSFSRGSNLTINQFSKIPETNIPFRCWLFQFLYCIFIFERFFRKNDWRGFGTKWTRGHLNCKNRWGSAFLWNRGGFEISKKPNFRITIRYEIPTFSSVGPFFEEGGRGLENFGQKLKF